MANANKVILIGNITRDLELRYIPGGQAVIEFTIAINQRYKDKAGQSQEKTDFIPIVAWGKQAELIKQYLSKGSSVYIEGRLQQDSWEDKNDGTKKSKLKVVAQQVQFLDRAKGQEAADKDGTKWAKEAPTKSAKTEEENLDEEIPF
ncbi:MAG: single-stranded DNA-binding protein [bacterium]|nr:single-stranded DNA-binding protein [bacterium]MDD5353893.1 single-stranded DNA-binding protein [bacterium]